MRASPPNGGPARRSKKNFEADMRLHRRFRRRPPTASRCSTALKLEGAATKADIVLGLDTNLTAEAQGDRPLRAAWRRRRRRPAGAPGTTTSFLPYDWGYFAFVYDNDEADRPAEEPEGPGRGRSEAEDRDPGPAHLDAGPRPAALGQGGLWRQGARSLGEAQAAHRHGDAGLGEAYGLFLKGEATWCSPTPPRPPTT